MPVYVCVCLCVRVCARTCVPACVGVGVCMVRAGFGFLVARIIIPIIVPVRVLPTASAQPACIMQTPAARRQYSLHHSNAVRSVCVYTHTQNSCVKVVCHNERARACAAVQRVMMRAWTF